MHVERFTGAQDFIERAGDYLAAREAEHNLLLGLSARLQLDPGAYGRDPYLAVAEQSGRIVAAALRTPPHNLVLSEIDDARACDALALDVREVFDTLPGVLGPARDVERFVRAWEGISGDHGRLAVAERIYRAESVTPTVGVTGRMRRYGPDDREISVRLLDAFIAEALPDAPAVENAEDVLASKLTDPGGGVVLWDSGRPVSLAGFGGATPNGIRVGPVYTSPDERGRGYGSALVAELTRELLREGRRFCFLFTNLANPTSNSIYQRVGYQAVADVNLWTFD